MIITVEVPIVTGSMLDPLNQLSDFTLIFIINHMR